MGVWVDSGAGGRELRPTFCDLDADGDIDLALGFGPGSGGQMALVYFEADAVDHVDTLTAGDATYHAEDGQTWPACGDVDGDDRNELVVGLGPAANAHLAAFDSFDTGFAPFDTGNGGMIEAPINGSMGTDGAGCIPSLGDIDGDGRDELVIGYTTAGTRSIAILDDGLRSFDRHETLRNGNGLLRIDGPTPGSSSIGGTYPALGDFDGDGIDEIATGYGAGSAAFLVLIDDVITTDLNDYSDSLRIRPGNGLHIPREAVRPAFGDIDGDGLDELVLSFGLEGTGELQVFEDKYEGGLSLMRGGAGFTVSPNPDVRWIAAPIPQRAANAP